MERSISFDWQGYAVYARLCDDGRVLVMFGGSGDGSCDIYTLEEAKERFGEVIDELLKD